MWLPSLAFPLCPSKLLPFQVPLSLCSSGHTSGSSLLPLMKQFSLFNYLSSGELSACSVGLHLQLIAFTSALSLTQRGDGGGDRER